MTLLIQLVLFLCWSGVVFLFATFINHKKWSVSLRPEFWLVCLCACFIPIIPLPKIDQAHLLLPEILLVDESLTGMLQSFQEYGSEALLSQSDSGEKWVAAGLVMFILLGIVRFGLELNKVHNIISKSEKVKLDYLFNQQQKLLLKKYDVRTRLTKDKVSPFSCGIVNTYIVLPEYVLNFPAQQISLLIDHEINHIKRQDHRWTMLVQLISVSVSFNFFLRLFARHYINATELRCDKDVLNAEPNNNLRKNYAQAMLLCLKNCVGIKERTIVAHFSNAETGLAFYQTRLKAIMGQSRATASNKQLLLTIALIFIVSGWVNMISANQPTAIGDDKGSWHLPLKGIYVTSSFGAIDSIRNHKSHGGIDLKAEIGTPVYAVKAGTVVIANSTSLSKNYGKTIVIKHADGYTSVYAHLDDFKVEENQLVSPGQIIGLTGETGKASGPHLHFELLQGDSRVDPARYLPF